MRVPGRLACLVRTPLVEPKACVECGMVGFCLWFLRPEIRRAPLVLDPVSGFRGRGKSHFQNDQVGFGGWWYVGADVLP